MKLKSILILSMVAILAMAGGAMAASTTMTNTNTLDTAGFAHSPGNIIGSGCAGGVGTAVVINCAPLTAAQGNALATDAQVGATTSGTGGGVNAMPAQVTYAANQYTGGVGPNSGYALNANLFGMCGGAGSALGAITQVCPKFVPAAGSVGLAAIGVTGFMPTGVDLFNEATFSTGLVGNMVTAGVITNGFSQKTTHHAAVTGGTLTNTDGDYIDQRLSQVLGTSQTLAQATAIGGSSGTSVIVAVDAAGQDPAWLLNVDPFGGLNAQNGGNINQAILDAYSGGAGDYGQLFSNTDVTVTNQITPGLVAGAATSYNAVATVTTAGAPLSLP